MLSAAIINCPPTMKLWPISAGQLPWRRILWACALAISVVVSVFAALRGGYIGPDYCWHLERMLNAKRFFDYSMADPPIYVILGHGLFRLIGRNNAFPITYSILQTIINAVALWWFFLYTERRFKSPNLHLALVFFLTFLPCRMTHAAVLGTDWMTIPILVLVVFAFEKFLKDETSTPKNAAYLGLALSLGMWSKYSFMSLLPAIFLLFLFLWWRRRWKLSRFVTICALSLILPTSLVVHSYLASTKAKDAAVRSMWLPKGGIPGHPEMTWKDLLTLKTRDVELFRAPEYFKNGQYNTEAYWKYNIRAAHKYSYLAKYHMSTFTDTMNLFQELDGPQNIGRILIPDFHTRRPWKTPWMMASVSLGTIWTLLALIGTPIIFIGAVRHLWRDKLEREDGAIFLAIAYFLLMFLPIPFLLFSDQTGAFLPRLTIAPQLCFFWAGFLLLDRTVAAKWAKSAFVVFGLVIIQCGIEIVMLS